MAELKLWGELNGSLMRGKKTDLQKILLTPNLWRVVYIFFFYIQLKSLVFSKTCGVHATRVLLLRRGTNQILRLL